MSRGQRLLALAALRQHSFPGRRARAAPRSPARGRQGRFGRGLPSGESRSHSGAPGAEPQRARRGPTRCRRCHRGGGRTSAGPCPLLSEVSQTGSRGGAPYPSPRGRVRARGRSSGQRDRALPGVLPRKEKLTNLGQGWRPLRSAAGPGDRLRIAASAGRAAPLRSLRSAGLREGSGQAAPLPSHVAIIFTRGSAELLGLPFAPAVAVVREQAGVRRVPRSPTDGRERRGRNPLSPSSGDAAGRALWKVPGCPAGDTCHRLLPQRGAQRGPAAGGCSATGPAPQPRRLWSGGGRRSGAVRLPPRPPPLPRPAPAARHTSVTDTAWGGVCSAMGSRGGRGRRGSPARGSGARPPVSPPAVLEPPAGRRDPRPGGCDLAPVPSNRAAGCVNAARSGHSSLLGHRAPRAVFLERTLHRHGSLMGFSHAGCPPEQTR